MTPRAIFYDATRVIEDTFCATPADRSLASALSAERSPAVTLVRLGARGPVSVSTIEAEKLASPEAAFSATRAWIVTGETGSAAVATPRPRSLFGFSRLAIVEAPAGSIYVKTGLRGWNDLAPWLAARRDLVVVALLENPWELDYPEYAGFDAQAASNAVRERANCILALTDALSPGAPLQHFASVPSALAGAPTGGLDHELAQTPFLIQIGPIEARANTLLLLQIWRDLARSGPMVPKLVLAGARGAQIEDIAPMLDWAQAIRPHVREAAHLSPDALRRLVVHARAFLAPDFAAPDCALLRDAGALGTKVLASNISAFDAIEAGDVERLDPLAGPAWRDAIGRAARREPREASDTAALPDWQGWSRRLLALLQDL